MEKGKDGKGDGICKKNKESIGGGGSSTEKDTGGNEEICR